MFKHNSNFLFVFLLITALNYVTNAQQWPPGMTKDPGSALFIYDDIHNFIIAYNSLAEEADSISVLQKQYLEKGTPGLKMFIKKYGLTAEMLLESIKQHPEKYNKLVEMPDLLADYSDSTINAFADLNGLTIKCSVWRLIG